MPSQLVPFWSSSGEMHLLEGFPEFFEVEPWMTDNLDGAPRSLLNMLAERLGSPVQSVKCLRMERNLVLELCLADEMVVIFRQLQAAVDAKEQLWRLEKLQTEVFVLQWLQQQNPAFPIPRVLIVVPGNEAIQSFFTMSKMPGPMLMNVCGLIQECLITSYAGFMLQMFELSVSESGAIGSIGPSGKGNAIEVVPKFGIVYEHSPNRVFTTISEYVDFLVMVKSKSDAVGTTEEDKHRALAAISLLKQYINELLQEFSDTALLRSTFVHGDLNTTNILVSTDGTIVAIVDWEAHSIQPAVLAATYPSWISYEGVRDPRFAPEGHWWEERREETARLWTLYEKVIRDASEEYYQALIRGRRLHHAIDWLLNFWPDAGGVRLQGWLKSLKY